VGQWVAPGTLLAKVVQPEKLKAELRVAETRMKDVQIGQRASIDTRNGIVAGHVARIDPAAQAGTVKIDVELDGQLPKGARPDLSVEGTIELERLANILFVGRPAFSQSEGQVGIFKLVDDGRYAERVKVRLGRSSVKTVEVVSGLREGDQVILSDLSQWDSVERIRLR
jgi:multidrug efflux pump subunit AcrA (membrane-fusion protein)